eukprot:gene3846-14369_t
MEWHRKLPEDTPSDWLVFPPDTSLHSYQFKITCVNNPEDNRTFNTSQPNFKVGDLTPGQLYKSCVRESLENDEGGEPEWGMYSETVIIEMPHPRSIRMAA